MGLFGPTIIREFEDKEPGYYFQVFLTRPKESKVRVNPIRMWETEKEALMDLPFIIPKFIERDSRDPDSFCITDASILVKTIFICKIEKPTKMGVEYAKIEDIEQDSLQRYLNKNNIMFKVKLQNSLVGASRNKIINIAILDIRDSLKNTEFTRKCVDYTFKNDGISYERFVTGYIDSIILANYDAYIGIPNPRRNVELLDKFYSELHDAVNSANSDILKMGFKINLLGAWDRGSLVLEPLSVSIGESNIIYEDPSNLKIDGQSVDDEGEDDDNTDYSIQDEPSEEDTQIEDGEPNPNEPEEGETAEEQPAEGDEPAEGEEDDSATDYRIPDNADEEPEDDTETQETEGEEPEQNEPEEGETTDDQPAEGDEPVEGEEDDAATDYRVNTDDAEGSGEDDGNISDDNQDSGDTSEDGSDNNEGQSEEDEAKAQEDEIFSNMSPEQRRIQDEELKENYVKLYNTIGDLIGRLEQIGTNNSTREPLTFAQNQLIDLKYFVFKYLSEVYSTKTYIENNINYQQYLAILSNINNLLTQLTTKSVDID